MSQTLDAAIYVRQSSDREGDHLAVDRQLEACQQLCDRKGWTPRWVFSDNDVSASTGRRRPEYQRLMSAIEDGQVQAVVAWHLDRLHRRPAELEHFIETADRHNVALATATGDVDLSTSTGRLVARIMGASARHEQEIKADRQRLRNQQAAKQGRAPGGRRPFGYEPGGQSIRGEEAALIRSGYDRLLSGSSLRSIAHEWNAAGLHGDGRYGARGHSKDGSTQKSTAWRPDSVRTVLSNPRNAAVRVYEGVEYAGTWPPVVREDVWRSAISLLTDPARRTTPTNSRRYLLSGYATCFCGALVSTGRSRRGQRTYQCSAHRHLMRAAEPVDEFVGAVVVERLSRPDARDLLVAPDRSTDLSAAREQRLILAQREDEAASLFVDGQISKAQLAKITQDIRAKMAALDSQLADSQRSSALADFMNNPKRVWESIADDVGRRRGVIATLFDVQLLSPGMGARTFNPATVVISWKDHGTS